MPTDPLNGSRTPASSAAPNVPQDMANLALDMADNTIPRFATTSARDTAYSNFTAAGGLVEDGEVCHTADAGFWKRQNGGWVGLYGMRAYGTATSAYNPTATATPVALNGGTLQLTAYLKAGRAYHFMSGNRVWSTVSGDAAVLSVRLSPSASTPTASDPLITSQSADLTNAGSANLYPLSARGSFQVNVTNTYKITLWGNRSGGSGTLTFYPLPSNAWTTELWDIGVAVPNLPAV